jgi:hypothetical protein
MTEKTFYVDAGLESVDKDIKKHYENSRPIRYKTPAGAACKFSDLITVFLTRWNSPSFPLLRKRAARYGRAE